MIRSNPEVPVLDPRESRLQWLSMYCRQASRGQIDPASMRRFATESRRELEMLIDALNQSLNTWRTVHAIPSTQDTLQCAYLLRQRVEAATACLAYLDSWLQDGVHSHLERAARWIDHEVSARNAYALAQANLPAA